MFKAALPFFAAWVVILGISACGDSSPATYRVPNNLISQSEAERQRPGSVEHVFLEYWSDLQYQSWAEVAAYYDPAFRDSVGTVAIIGGKKINGSSYPQLKPTIVRVGGNDDFTTINYSLLFIDGTKELASVTWRKNRGSWQLVFDSRLDAELKQYAENQVELEENGTLPTEVNDVSPEAVRAGAAAAQAQARFVQQALGLKTL
ncbi:MAG TPA: hypothetical protein VN752_05985 [Solirubrobacterales bacterium]|nr:hypothetical protein [Solirubrobacterales bacterium]